MEAPGTSCTPSLGKEREKGEGGIGLATGGGPSGLDGAGCAQHTMFPAGGLVDRRGQGLRPSPPDVSSTQALPDSDSVCVITILLYSIHP